MIGAETVSKYSVSKMAQTIAMIDVEYRILQDKLKNNEDISEKDKTALKLYESELNQTYSKIAYGIKEAVGLLQKNDCVEDVIVPEAGNLLFVKIHKSRTIRNSHSLFLYLLEHANVAVAPGNLFFTPEEELWFRISMTRDPEIFLENVQKILYTLSALKERIK